MSEIAAADEPTPIDQKAVPRRSRAGAFFVSVGIFTNKIFGVVRQSFIATYLGAGATADAFNAAIRIPNLLQTLFGDGALSASFIPVYVGLRTRGDEEEAGRVAGAVFAILALVVSILVLLGVLFTPQILPLIVWGFKGERRELAITYVRILFPGAGLFVLGAWCLGVLNSHRKFLLSYMAPVLWNVTMIAALIWYGPRESLASLARITAWASVIGAAAQFLVQLPFVLALVKQFHMSLDWRRPSVRTVLRNFAPVGVSRGVVQVSSYIDQLISSLLPEGMVSLLFYATTISYVPVALFGMSISAAELPEMASVVGEQAERARQLRERLNAGLRQIAFFVVPSAAAMLVAGDVMAAALFQHGRHFSRQDTIYTWSILAGSSVGLLASTMGRLYSSTYYALHDTRTPLRFAIVRVLLTTVLGVAMALGLPKLLHIDPHWGGAALTVSFGIAGWVEFTLLRRGMNQRIGDTGLPIPLAAKLWSCAALAAAAALGLKVAFRSMPAIPAAVIVLGGFGLVYLAAAILTKVPEARILVRRFGR
jgi:putative peptidoglycan lipid II flippase